LRSFVRADPGFFKVPSQGCLEDRSPPEAEATLNKCTNFNVLVLKIYDLIRRKWSSHTGYAVRLLDKGASESFK